MRIVFMGSPEFAVPSFRALVESNWQVVGVLTKADRPKGRGHKVVSTPIKALAMSYGIPVEEPSRLADVGVLEKIGIWAPDCIVVTAYGLKLPAEVLRMPRLGCVNVHPSLLPKYRGAEPIRRPILNGDSTTGVTTMFMDEEWDTGDMILQVETKIDPDETFGELSFRLAEIGAELLVATLSKLANGETCRAKQPSTAATRAPRLGPELEVIDFAREAVEVHNQIRALSPEPGAYTGWRGTRIKVFRSKVVEREGPQTPGKIVLADKVKGLVVGAASGLLELREVCPAGKKSMTGAAFINGYRPEPGEILGDKEF